MEPDIIVVMGVAGTGKTTVAKALASRLGWTYAEGDAFHSEANIAKMAGGTPLDDSDRWPWLEAIGAWISDQVAAGESAVVTCSALRRAYREVLRDGRPQVRFLHLEAPPEELERRMSSRTDHFMPSSLLASQFATLEPLGPDEPGVCVSVLGDGPEVTARALTALGLS